MEGLRQYKQIQRLRISAADIAGGRVAYRVGYPCAERRNDYVEALRFHDHRDVDAERSSVADRQRRGEVIERDRGDRR